jgi:fatty-acyl-CoA synthase
MAAGLAGVGIGPGSGFACLHGNTPEAIMVRLAGQLLGARYIGLRPIYAIAEQAKALADADVFIFEPDRQDEAFDLLALAPVPNVRSLGPSAWAENLLAVDRVARLEDFFDRPEQTAMVAFTSGTTGRPKGVGHSFAAASAFLDAARWMYGPGSWRFLVAIPLSDLGGDLAQWTLATGGTVVLEDDFEPVALLTTIERERITHLFLDPSSLYKFAEHRAVMAADLSSIRQIIYGGGAATPTRTAQAVKTLGLVVAQNYGAQEAGFITSLSCVEHAREELLSSVGRSLPGVEITIRDNSGNTLRNGLIGEVWLRSPMVMSGYWRDAEQTARVVRDGWLVTGDIGRLDKRGYLYLVDRSVDMIIVEAYNVYSRRVEQVLAGHPGVREAVVVGVPDSDSGEAVCAAVVPATTAALDASELRSLVGDTLGDIHIPRRVEFVAEIPLTPRGKPDKAAVRKLFTEAS